MIELIGNITTIKTGKLDVNAENINGKYPFFTCSKNHTYIDNYAFEGESILVAGNGDLNVKYYNGKFNAYQRTYVIQPNKSLNGKYLYYFLEKYVEKLREQSIGGVIKYIKLGNLTDAKIPLPDLPTQQKIASILDKADELRQYNQQLIDKYDNLTQSLFLDMFGDPVKNEKGWEKRKLGELGNWKSGGTPSRKIEKYFQGTIPWISSGELNEMYIYKSKEYITEEAIQNTSTHLIEKGSLLLGMYDTAALKSSINTVVLTCNQAIAFAKLNKTVNTLYVYYIIQYGKKHYKSQQRGVRQKNLNLSMIKDLKINYPPIELQNQFAERIKIIEEQKQQAQEALAKSELLFQGLLQQAFNGELS